MTSKSLRSISQLEHNVPGCIVSIKIPSAEITKLHGDKMMVEINCKSFFSKLVKNSEAAKNSSGALGSTSVELPPPEPKFAKIANRYDNIIDQLERKYYCESMLQSNNDGSDESDGSDSEPMLAEDSNGAALSGTAPTSKPNKRKKVFADDYDVDDPFIDDEEMICEVEAAMKTNRTKTKHDGFFVSSGKLEVLSPKKMQKISTATNKSQKETVKSAAVETKEPAVQETIEEDGTKGDKNEKGDAKKRKRRTKKEIEEAIARGEFKPKPRPTPDDPSAATVTPVSTAGDAAAAISSITTTVDLTKTEDASEKQRLAGAGAGGDAVVAASGALDVAASPTAPAARPKVEKAEWQPNEPVLRAMLEYQSYYEKCGVKLCKSSNIPKSLEEPLNAVDCKVIAHILPEVLARTSGYYEGLQSIMGGEVNVGKIRSLLTRLRLRDIAEKTRLVIEAQVNSLMGDLKANVTPCPEKLQPAAKAAKKAQQQANNQQAQSAGADVSASPQQGAAEGETVGVSGEAVDETAMNVDAATLLVQQNPSTITSEEPVAPAEAAAASSSAAASAPISTATAGAASARYEWVCNWDRPMKITLCQIEHNLKVWVLQENLYREKLTVHDKKYLSEREVPGVSFVSCLLLRLFCFLL